MYAREINEISVLSSRFAGVSYGSCRSLRSPLGHTCGARRRLPVLLGALSRLSVLCNVRYGCANKGLTGLGLVRAENETARQGPQR